MQIFPQQSMPVQTTKQKRGTEKASHVWNYLALGIGEQDADLIAWLSSLG